jgi:pantetheine-phosphate adenylyltransferase
VKIAVYPGSFNPWHEGHSEVLEKALLVFDHVVVLQGYNPDKNKPAPLILPRRLTDKHSTRISTDSFNTLLVEYLENKSINAIVKGLRNGMDFEYEKTQQYWNEDLRVKTPVFYVIASRGRAHISSSAIRSIERFKNG